MKFIEKNARSLGHSRVVARATLSRELYDSSQQEAFQVLAEWSAKKFHDEFGEEPHPSWFDKREFSQPDANTVEVEVTLMLPRSGDTVIAEGDVVELPVTVYGHSRIPIKVPEPFIQEAAEGDILPVTVHTTKHIGWDADSGLMVFGKGAA